MKKIWRERVSMGHHVEKEVFNGQINSSSIPIWIAVSAYYDKALGHAVLDIGVRPSYRFDEEPFPWGIEDQRVTGDNLVTREDATLWVIRQIYTVAADVRRLIPPSDCRSDDEILATATVE